MEKKTLIKTYVSRYWLFILSVIIGFALRYWASFSQPVFSDEAFSIYEARFWEFPYDPSYPPGYPLFLKLWTNVSTTLPWARLPSVLAGTLSLIIFWRILATHLTPRVANIGVLLLATSALHIHYSWIARPNSITALISMISLSQLLNLAATLKNKSHPRVIPLLLYFATNAIGAFFCHGYTMFLAGSIVSLIIWTLQTGMWQETIRHNKIGLGIVASHALLPLMQLAFIYGRITPLVDSAEWIPDFSIYSITSAFLTLFNGAKTLTSEMWTAAPITVYFTLIILVILSRLFYTMLRDISPFMAVLFVSLCTTSILGVAAVDMFFDMNILQPRLLIPINIMYTVGVSVTLAQFFRFIKSNKIVRFPYKYEAVFLVILLIFSVRSLLLLNIAPYYGDRKGIEIITSLKNDTDTLILIFPRYQVITVKYLWGLDNPYPASLYIADKVSHLPPDAPMDALSSAIPDTVPIKIIRWPSDSTLSPGARAFVNQLAPACQKQHYGNIDILDCPPMTRQ